jgi:hypothetical protein
VTATPATIPQNITAEPQNIIAQAAASSNVTEGNIEEILRTIPNFNPSNPTFDSPDDLPDAAVGKPVARYTVFDFPFTPNAGELYQMNSKGNLFRVDLIPGDIYQVNKNGILKQIPLPFSFN